MNHSPITTGPNSIAFKGQINAHTPHPSQASESTRYVFATKSFPEPSKKIASERQFSLNLLHAAHSSGRILARLPREWLTAENPRL